MFAKLLGKFVQFLWRWRIRNGIKVIDREMWKANFDVVPYGNSEQIQFLKDTHRFIPTDFKEQFSWIDELGASDKTWEIDAPFYSTVTNVELRGKRCLAFDAKSNVFLESSLDSKGYLIKSGDAKYALLPFFYRIETHIDCAISLINILSKNYYHWVCDVLPVLEAYFHFVKKTDIKPKVFIDRDPPKFQRQFLSLFGINDSEILEWTYNRISVRNWLVPTARYRQLQNDFFASGFILSKKALDWVSTTIDINPNQKKGRKIFISRSDASTRKLLNESEVLEYLKRHGFESVTMSGMDVSQQIQLFQEAEWIVTVHGAAMANLIFTRETRVIELFPAKRKTYSTNIYYQIAQFYRHQHWIISCEQNDEDENMKLELGRLESVLA